MLNKNEQDLFFTLCKLNNPDVKKIRELITTGATAELLGQLFYNRMAAIAYLTLYSVGLLGNVTREFRNSISSAHEYNACKNVSFFTCVKLLTKLLKQQDGNYAMLKGAYLCPYFPEGARTSNDIDILVRHNDVTTIGEILTSAGFKQGNVKNGVFLPATRREIVASKMLRGETVPYILEVGLPYLKFMEVDINFSVDYKNDNGEIVDLMLTRQRKQDINGIKIPTLNTYDFLIHLCLHLYKEATTLPWVTMGRDMTLYKFWDIYMLIDTFSQTDVNELFEQARELGTEYICACVLIWTNELIGINNPYAVNKAKRILKGKTNMLHEVISPSEELTYVYTQKDVRTRFFSDNREELLKEKA